jgi:hypothetical protein
MGGGIRHAAPATARTKPAALTRKSHEPVEAAGVTVNAQKAPGQDPAIEEGAQLPFHKPGHVPVPLPLPLEEILQLRGNDPIEDAFRGIAGYIQPDTFTNVDIRFSRHERAIGR